MFMNWEMHGVQTGYSATYTLYKWYVHNLEVYCSDVNIGFRRYVDVYALTTFRWNMYIVSTDDILDFLNITCTWLIKICTQHDFKLYAEHISVTGI